MTKVFYTPNGTVYSVNDFVRRTREGSIAHKVLNHKDALGVLLLDVSDFPTCGVSDRVRIALLDLVSFLGGNLGAIGIGGCHIIIKGVRKRRARIAIVNLENKNTLDYRISAAGGKLLQLNIPILPKKRKGSTKGRRYALKDEQLHEITKDAVTRKECACCKELFTPKSANHVFCSVRCREVDAAMATLSKHNVI